jgi:hypothetical protein
MLMPYSGMLRCRRRTMASVPLLLSMWETPSIVCVTQRNMRCSHRPVARSAMCMLTGDSSMLPTGVGVVIDMVLLHMVCMHHVPRLSYTRCLPCWCWKRL